MSKPPVLTDRQKAALRPLLRAVRKMEMEGILCSDGHVAPAVWLDSQQWLSFLYEFDTLT